MSKSCLDKQTFICYTYLMSMESSVRLRVIKYLRHLGLSSEQALIYLYLQENGPSSVLAVSRGLRTGRTKLYPALDNMIARQVVNIHERHYGTTYEALPPENLEFLVEETERKTSQLRHGLQATVHALNVVRTSSPTNSKVIEYHGVDGLKQMNWNLTKAEKYFKVYELTGLDKHLAPHFAEKLRQTWTDKGIRSYDLTNNPDHVLSTKIEGYSELSEARYISPDTFAIEFETYVYDNVVALLSYEDGDIFGVEIYNEKLARQQEQLFNLLWEQAEYLK